LINTVNQNLQYLLPLDLELSNEGLKKWLQKRTIHRNRAYVSNFLSRLGLNEKDTKGIIDICQGLSLNVSITKPSPYMSSFSIAIILVIGGEILFAKVKS
jgi:hypothetical protein